MNLIATVVLPGLLYFARRPAYSHPLPASKPLVRRQPLLPPLPPELYSLIASYLDQSTLASCALVSSTWRSASRQYFFHTITLAYANIQPFLDLSYSPLCSFKHAIKVVKIREGEFIVDRWIDQFLPRLITFFNDNNSIRVLDVYNLTWSELSPRSIKALQQGFQLGGNMQSLRVGTCYWECVHKFAELVCLKSFDGLKHLVCDYSLLNCSAAESCECRRVEEVLGGEETSRRTVCRSSTSLPPRPTITARLPQTLESLYLSLPEESILHWLMATQDTTIRGLKKLGVAVCDSMVIPLVGELVSRTGGTLEELVLDLPLCCSISLARNVSLRSLRLRIPSLFSFSDDTTSAFTNSHLYHHHHHQNHGRNNHALSLQTLHRLLSSLSSPSFHTLIFDINATSLLCPRYSSTTINGKHYDASRLHDFASVVYSSIAFNVPIPSSFSSSSSSSSSSTAAITTSISSPPPSPQQLSLKFSIRYSGPPTKTFERAKNILIHSFTQILHEQKRQQPSVDWLRWNISVEGVRVGNIPSTNSDESNSDHCEQGKYEEDEDGAEGEEEEEEEDIWRREGVGEVWKSWIG